MGAGEFGRYGIARNGRTWPIRGLVERAARLIPEAPTVGVVIGTFAALPYVHLQLEARRRLYPEVPLLVHDDHSPEAARLEALCREYGADFEQNTTRFPPCKGDLSAMAGGFVWARERQLDLLVKFSRTFLPQVCWVDGFLELVREADYATYSSWTTTFDFGFRTECVAFAVEEWFARGFCAEIAAAIVAPPIPFVEGFIHEFARRAAVHNSVAAEHFDDQVGRRPADRDGYAVWPLIGKDRCQPQSQHLWHDASAPTDYARVATRWGLPYSVEDFADPNMGHGAMPEPPVAAGAPSSSRSGKDPDSCPRVVVYTIAHNEELLIPYFARNYAWADRIVIYDDLSTDRTRELAEAFPNVEVRRFDSGGRLDNRLLLDIKNHCWKECRGEGIDYVIVVDADEFVWAPEPSKTFRRWRNEGITLVRPSGYDLVGSQVPTGAGLLHEEINCGRADGAYDKPCIFAPDRLREICFTPGAHDCDPIGEVRGLRTSEVKLLHCRYLGAEFFVQRMRLRRERRCAEDCARGWGVHYERSDEEFQHEFERVLQQAVPVV